MNFLYNYINQSVADLLINCLKSIKERSCCSEMFCEKGVLKDFAKFLSTPFFKEYLCWLLLKEYMQTKPPLVFCSWWKGKHWWQRIMNLSF